MNKKQKKLIVVIQKKNIVNYKEVLFNLFKTEQNKLELIGLEIETFKSIEIFKQKKASFTMKDAF